MKRTQDFSKAQREAEQLTKQWDVPAVVWKRDGFYTVTPKGTSIPDAEPVLITRGSLADV